MKTANIAARLKSINVGDIGNRVLNHTKNTYKRAKNCKKVVEEYLTFALVYDGPVTNSALVARELVTLVAQEQQMVRPPTTQQLEHAKEIYLKLWTQVKPEGGVTLSSFSRIGNMTWSQFASGGKVALELSAYYYIGSLIGSTAALPLSLVFRH